MKDLLELTGYSRQALFKHRMRQHEVVLGEQLALTEMARIRKSHKRMGCRSMYAVCSSLPMGRDKFEKIGHAGGYKLKRKICAHKTTWGQKVEVCPNLVEGIKINNINKVWQSDIFYQKIEGRDMYGFTIIDVYTRRLLALHMTDNMRATEMVKALRQAIQARKGSNLEGTIFHSDRGSQYISEKVKKLLNHHGFIRSMCKMPQENAYVERVQGTIKNDYLQESELTISNYKKVASQITRLYNWEKPHSGLGMKTPIAFEQHIMPMPTDERPVLEIYQGFK